MTPLHSALVVNCCGNENLLTMREFVWPIQRLLPIPSRVVHISKLKARDVEEVDMIVFSGCPLKDNEYVKKIPKIKWLIHTHKPLLGICAGQHVIGSLFGGKIHSGKPDIGVHAAKKTREHPLTSYLDLTFSVYSLHGNWVSLPDGFISLAKSPKNKNEIMVHTTKSIVGVSFHPEVLNKSFFVEFVKWAQTKRN